mmetsp:Transcript_7093/g.17798  ORF Transcript_7093/g.17798 Transcript_7093/m.17798 type:complete len:223 (-) Transcript_7093:174-842(-)
MDGGRGRRGGARGFWRKGRRGLEHPETHRALGRLALGHRGRRRKPPGEGVRAHGAVLRLAELELRDPVSLLEARLGREVGRRPGRGRAPRDLARPHEVHAADLPRPQGLRRSARARHLLEAPRRLPPDLLEDGGEGLGGLSAEPGAAAEAPHLPRTPRGSGTPLGVGRVGCGSVWGGSLDRSPHVAAACSARGRHAQFRLLIGAWAGGRSRRWCEGVALGCW